MNAMYNTGIVKQRNKKFESVFIIIKSQPLHRNAPFHELHLENERIPRGSCKATGASKDCGNT